MPYSKLMLDDHKGQIKYFVETGSFDGDGIQGALDAGFEKIISIEINNDKVMSCRKRFSEEDKVNIIQGDSAGILYHSIKDIDEQIIFWLDAHFDFSGTWCPLLKELDEIGKHHIKNHIILIDDLRNWRRDNRYLLERGGTMFGEEDIKEKVFMINEKYDFFYEDGIIENDILVAKVLN